MQFKNKKSYFITAIHTDAGKTFISALLVKALNANYWKPIQSGIEIRDTEEICRLARIENTRCFDERYLLKSPESPHSAAKKEGIELLLDTIELPNSMNNLIVEGAGGILVPINEEQTIVDVIQKLNIPIILVVPTYLGCINHTLLTLEVLKARNLKLEMIIFNGDESKQAQDIIIKKANNVKNYRVPKVSKDDFVKFDEISVELSQLFL